MRPLARESVELIDAARDGDDPRPGDRERMRRRLLQAGVGVAVVASAGAASAGVSAASVAAKAAGAGMGTAASAASAAGAGGGLAVVAGSSVGAIAVKVFAVAAIAIGVGAAGVKGVSTYRSHAAAANVSTQGIVPAPKALPAVVGAAPAAPPPVVELSPIEPVVSEPAAVVGPAGPERAAVGATGRPAPRAEPSVVRSEAASAAAPSTLEMETRLLRDAEVSMRSGDASRALLLLDEHAARFPNGVLGEERAAERVLALCALGRTQDARADMQKFLRERPRSPLADRVRASCVGSTAP